MKPLVIAFTLTATFLGFIAGFYFGSVRMYRAAHLSEQVVATKLAANRLAALYSGKSEDIKDAITSEELLIALHYQNHLLDLNEGLPTPSLKQAFFPVFSGDDTTVWTYGQRLFANEPLFPYDPSCPSPIGFEKLTQMKTAN